jgi:hypothetical protein
VKVHCLPQMSALGAFQDPARQEPRPCLKRGYADASRRDASRQRPHPSSQPSDTEKQTAVFEGNGLVSMTSWACGTPCARAQAEAPKTCQSVSQAKNCGRTLLGQPCSVDVDQFLSVQLSGSESIRNSWPSRHRREQSSSLAVYMRHRELEMTRMTNVRVRACSCGHARYAWVFVASHPCVPIENHVDLQCCLDPPLAS